MKILKMLIIAVTVCLLVGASGPAQAQRPRQDAAEIIADFCEAVSSEAGDTIEKLGNAAGDLAECTEEFGDCRDGGLFGNDPLVECLAKGIECTARAG